MADAEPQGLAQLPMQDSIYESMARKPLSSTYSLAGKE